MGSLQEDTELEGNDGRYVAKVSPDWDGWVPNGGYLSSIALRAAAAETDLTQPASYYCHYLNPGVSGQMAELTVTTLRKSRTTHAMRVEMSQVDRPVLEALVWAITPPGSLDYSYAQMPEVPGPHGLRSGEDIHAPDPAPFAFWQNLESKPVTWTGRWDERPVMHPLWRAWNRFRPAATFEDPFVDACRSLVLIDTMLYPAAAITQEQTFPFMAPSMDLAVRFHVPSPEAEWLLSSTETPVAAGGLLGGYAAVWSEDGRLVATGGQQMLVKSLMPNS